MGGGGGREFFCLSLLGCFLKERERVRLYDAAVHLFSYHGRAVLLYSSGIIIIERYYYIILNIMLFTYRRS